MRNENAKELCLLKGAVGSCGCVLLVSVVVSLLFVVIVALYAIAVVMFYQRVQLAQSISH